MFPFISTQRRACWPFFDSAPKLQVSSSVQTEVLQSSEKSLTMTLTVSFPNIAAAIINAVLLNFAGALSALLPSVYISASPKGFQRLGSVDRCLDALRKDQLPLLESCALVQTMKHPDSNVLVLIRLACFFSDVWVVVIEICVYIYTYVYYIYNTNCRCFLFVDVSWFAWYHYISHLIMIFYFDMFYAIKPLNNLNPLAHVFLRYSWAAFNGVYCKNLSTFDGKSTVWAMVAVDA